jgi:hypothetical protein
MIRHVKKADRDEGLVELAEKLRARLGRSGERQIEDWD